MEIRKANQNDYIHIVRSIQNKHIAYITPSLIKLDIQHSRLYVIIENNIIIGSVSFVYDDKYNYYAIKRLCIYNKKNHHKGYAFKLLQFVSKIKVNKIGCTPWEDNYAMKHMLEKLGFSLQYIFDEKWCFYLKETLIMFRC